MTSVGILGAFIRRDWLITRSYRLQFVLELGGLLFQLVLFFYLGRLVDRAELGEASGITGSYFSFVALGLALFNLLNMALTSVSSTLRSEQITGSLEALLVTPQPSSILITATSSYAFIRGTINMVLFLGMSVVFFGLRVEPDPWSLLAGGLALIAGVVLFGALGLVVAAITLVYKRATAFLSLITSSIALFGGVYFPVSVLPEPLRILANLLPVTWALSAMRQALLEGVVDGSRFLALLATSVVVLPLSVLALNYALNKARQDGSLAQY